MVRAVPGHLWIDPSYRVRIPPHVKPQPYLGPVGELNSRVLNPLGSTRHPGWVCKKLWASGSGLPWVREHLTLPWLRPSNVVQVPRSHRQSNTELCLPTSILLSLKSFAQSPFSFGIEWTWSWIKFEIIHSILEPGQSLLHAERRNADLVASCTSFSIHCGAHTGRILGVLVGYSLSFGHSKNESQSCSETQHWQWSF